MELRYLYVGSSDVGRDVAAWLKVPGAEVRWRLRHFGADVAAIDIGLMSHERSDVERAQRGAETVAPYIVPERGGLRAGIAAAF